MVYLKIDLTNKQCENFKVINRNIEKKGKNVWWNCQCKCGNIITVERSKLISRGQKSCGCKNSIGELNINKLLTDNNINYISQYTN